MGSVYLAVLMNYDGMCWNVRHTEDEEGVVVNVFEIGSFDA